MAPSGGVAELVRKVSGDTFQVGFVGGHVGE